MPKIIAFPIPYDAIAKYECPEGHKSGWTIYAVEHEAGTSFLTLSCRTKGCTFATCGMLLTGMPVQTFEVEE